MFLLTLHLPYSAGVLKLFPFGGEAAFQYTCKNVVQKNSSDNDICSVHVLHTQTHIRTHYLPHHRPEIKELTHHKIPNQSPKMPFIASLDKIFYVELNLTYWPHSHSGAETEEPINLPN